MSRAQPSKFVKFRLQIQKELFFNNALVSLACLFRAGSVRGSSSPGPSASVAASRRSSPGDARLHEDPTLPVQRKLVWDEGGLGDRDESEISHEELTIEENEGNPKDKHEDMKGRNERYVLYVLLKCDQYSCF